MKTFQQLVRIKREQGFLAGRDALDALHYTRSAGGRWTRRDFEQLTRWQLGLPTTVQFQIVAGGARMPQPVSVSAARPLLRRKYATFEERNAARKGKEAARQASLRRGKVA